METEPEASQKIKKLLSPYVKPREEVAYIRRVLALHLQQQRQTESLPIPLSLLGPTDDVSQQPQGGRHNSLLEKYLEAAAENVKAQQEYSSLRQDGRRIASPPNPAPETDTNPLEEHLTQAKLRKKQERLQALQKYVDRLEDRSTITEAGNLELIFQDGLTLPDVPHAVMDGFTNAATEGKSGLTEVLDRMERVVLCTKLILRREEQLLHDARERAEHASRGISDEARLEAFNQTRNELIAWIETELSKAGSGDEGEAEGAMSRQEPDTDISLQLEEIKEKYSQYLEMRKTLLGCISQASVSQSHPKLSPPLSTHTPEESPEPQTHQMIPYLEKLVELSRKQKGMIQHKSHLTTTLSKEARETRKALTYLAEESQLLPRHPMPGSRSKGSFEEHIAGAATDKPDTAKQVQPWVYAADSAKIATFEVVAEQVEQGQLALEDSMKTLFEIDQLLGREGPDEGPSQEGEDDVWLAEAGATGRGHARKQKAKSIMSNDPWAALRGDLGLIGEDGYRS